MAEFRFIDLFSGAGGTALGFVRAGFRADGAADIDPDACRTYEALVGLPPLCADLSALPPEAAAKAWGIGSGEADILLGCPPCQGFTRLRNGAGANDPRNRLVLVFLDYVDFFRPRLVVFENVPGLARLPHGRDFYEGLLEGLARLGYRLRAREVDAADYGVPQHRRRLIVVGALGTDPPPFPEPTHGRPDSPEVRAGLWQPWITVREAIGHLRPLQPGEADPNDPMHRAPRMGERVARFIALVPKDGGSRTDVPEEEWLSCHWDHDGHWDVYGRLAWDRPAGVITSGCCNVSKGRFAHPEQDRAIAPREAALLQGFPPDAVFYGSFQSIRHQIGNAVPPPLAEAIARSCRNFLETRRRKEAVADTPDSAAFGADTPCAGSRVAPPPTARRAPAKARTPEP
jgi:DNA (cytosine-5)-methyltransferase 1